MKIDRPAWLMSIIDKVYRDHCKVVRVVGTHSEFISEFPLDLTLENPFSPEDIPAGHELLLLDMDVRKSAMMTAITPNFWTCNCKESYTRHIGDAYCEKCCTGIMDSISRLPLLNYMKEPQWAKHAGKLSN